MCVGEYIDIQVQLQEAVETITVTDDGTLDTNGIFLVGLDENSVLVSVEFSEVRSVFTILVDHLGVALK
jgi:hypothetical protein